MGPGLCRRRITFKCGAVCEMVGLTESDLDEEEVRWSQQDCFKCRLEDGTITEYELDVLAASMAYSVLRVEHEISVSDARVN